VTLTLKEAEATLEPRDAGALKTKQKISEGLELALSIDCQILGNGEKINYPAEIRSF
jgi:hypothetical protein